MRKYGEFEQHVIEKFNSCDGLVWNGIYYNKIEAYKPRTSQGECKTDIYVTLKNQDGIATSLKISIKKDDAEFMGNKLTANDAESLLGADWQSILIQSIKTIKMDFVVSSIFYAKPKINPTDIFFTLGWKLEIANKQRKLSAPLALNDEQIINRVYRGTQQPDHRKNATVGNEIIINSGIADYILQGTASSLPNINSILNNLIELKTSTFSPPQIYLIFTANNYRIMANKADGPRTLAVAIAWLAEGNKIKPVYIFNEPLVYRGETDMMPLIKQSLESIGISQYTYQNKDTDIVELFNKIAPHLQLT